MFDGETIDGLVRSFPDIDPRRLRQVADYLAGDYIPPGARPSPGRGDVVNVRSADQEIGFFGGLRCGFVTGEDVQSGPFFCGRPGVVVADSKADPAGMYVACQRHRRGLEDACQGMDRGPAVVFVFGGAEEEESDA